MSESPKKSRRKLWLSLVGLLLLVTVIGLVFISSARGLEYAGHPWSFWQEQVLPDRTKPVRFPGFRLTEEAEAAAREVGGNEVATLVKMISRPRYGLGARVLDWVENPRVPFGVKRYLEPIYPKSYHPAMAILLFRAAGAAAAPAIPELVDRLYDPVDARWAGLALSELGPQGVAALEKEFPLIHDHLVRANILNQLHHQAHLATFVAQRMMEDPHSAVRMSAAGALGTYTGAGETVVRALIEGLTHDDAGVRMVASRSIIDFGPAAASAIEPLRGLLNDDHPDVRDNAGRALESIQGFSPAATDSVR